MLGVVQLESLSDVAGGRKPGIQCFPSLFALFLMSCLQFATTGHAGCPHKFNFAIF